MPKIITTIGYDNLLRTLDRLLETTCGQINIYFYGKKDKKGKSWCQNCNNAQPYLVDAVRHHARKDSILIEADVGVRKDWKDRQNIFRRDWEFHLRYLPTIIRYQTDLRLELEELTHPELLEEFFTRKE